MPHERLWRTPRPHGTCDAYRRVNFSDERADIACDTRWLPRAEYRAHALRHRFCVAAPGDYWSTTKLADAIAAGGAGGCA